MKKKRYPSFAKITKTDLARLAALATECLDDMLARTKTGKFYSADSVLMGCLCQGAARHYLHGDRGVNDFDVVFFFQTNPAKRFPYRWKGKRDFGRSKFGVNPTDARKYVGRRIDVMGRDVPVPKGMSAEQAIAAYLRDGKARSAREWAKRPVVALTPRRVLGNVIWTGPDCVPSTDRVCTSRTAKRPMGVVFNEA